MASLPTQHKADQRDSHRINTHAGNFLVRLTIKAIVGLALLAKLSRRAHVLGGRKFKCADCDEVKSLYNSCGDLHCPQCSGGRRVNFHEKATKLILAGVTYYQVVFTLPSELSELALASRHELADLLVDSAWKSLSGRVKAEQDYAPAAMTVLHTWNQKLDAHWHVHMLMPGAGPGLSRPHWKQAIAPPLSGNSDGFYLVDADQLRESYRQKAITKLRRLRAAGKLEAAGVRQAEPLAAEDRWERYAESPDLLCEQCGSDRLELIE